MASATSDNNGEHDGVKFIHEEDGSITAKDLETGFERGGDSRAEALVQLAEVLALEDGDGEEIDDPDAFLADLGIERSDDPRDLPEFLR